MNFFLLQCDQKTRVNHETDRALSTDRLATSLSSATTIKAEIKMAIAKLAVVLVWKRREAYVLKRSLVNSLKQLLSSWDLRFVI